MADFMLFRANRSMLYFCNNRSCFGFFSSWKKTMSTIAAAAASANDDESRTGGDVTPVSASVTPGEPKASSPAQAAETSAAAAIHPSGVVPVLQCVCVIEIITSLYCCRNIVATVNLECRLDLKTIALHARNAEYNPKVSKREAAS
jgi:hypothetical protein